VKNISFTPTHMAEYYQLHEAVKAGNADAVDSLITLVSIDALDQYGSAPLHHAYKLENSFILSKLIYAGADVKIQRNGIGLQPTHIAAIHGRLDAIVLLIHHGADVGARNFDNGEECPIHLSS
jgi:ankyrin repeat protein